MAPYDIPVGEVYAHVITDALENCSCMVLLLTRDSQESQFVCREVEAIISMNKPILPVQLETLELNKEFRFFLNTNQILSLTKPNLNDPKCQMLLNKIKNLMTSDKKPDFTTNDSSATDHKPHKKNLKTIAAVCIFLIIAVIAGSTFFGKSNDNPNEDDMVAEDTDAWKSNILAFNSVDSDGSSSEVYDFDINREQVVSVTFLDTITDAPTDAHDVSSNQNGSVLAWITQNGEKYDLCFAAEGGINASDASAHMFRYYTSLNEINFNNALHTDMSTEMQYMFADCFSLQNLDVSHFNTSNVTNMEAMFYACRSLTELDLSSFDTSNVTNMKAMFFDCKNITELDLSGFDTSNVTNMEHMFRFCEKLNQLDVSSFDTSKITNMQYMFADCFVLEELDVSNFDTSNVENMEGMFYGCKSLTKLDLSSFDFSSLQNYSAFMSTGTTYNGEPWEAIFKFIHVN